MSATTTSHGKSVFCKRLNREAQALESPPFPGVLGVEIQQNVSAQAWHEWADDMMIKIINEYRLNLADAEQYEVLLKQMRAFLNLDSSAAVLEVENAERGRKDG